MIAETRDWKVGRVWRGELVVNDLKKIDVRWKSRSEGRWADYTHRGRWSGFRTGFSVREHAGGCVSVKVASKRARIRVLYPWPRRSLLVLDSKNQIRKYLIIPQPKRIPRWLDDSFYRILSNWARISGILFEHFRPFLSVARRGRFWICEIWPVNTLEMYWEYALVSTSELNRRILGPSPYDASSWGCWYLVLPESSRVLDHPLFLAALCISALVAPSINFSAFLPSDSPPLSLNLSLLTFSKVVSDSTWST